MSCHYCTSIDGWKSSRLRSMRAEGGFLELVAGTTPQKICNRGRDGFLFLASWSPGQPWRHGHGSWAKRRDGRLGSNETPIPEDLIGRPYKLGRFLKRQRKAIVKRQSRQTPKQPALEKN